MPVWLEIIVANICIGLACYARGLFLELKSTKEHLEMSKRANKQLSDKLAIANRQIAELRVGNNERKPVGKTASFLLADDPMGEILKSVGEVDW